jgi:hypothetical protein
MEYRLADVRQPDGFCNGPGEANAQPSLRWFVSFGNAAFTRKRSEANVCVFRPPPPAEPRRLSEARFGLLFDQLRGHELAGILGEFDLRRWGTKDVQVSTLWESHRSETTLLACLSNPELDVILRRVDLKTGGSKSDRIERLVEHFAVLDEVAFRAAQSVAPGSLVRNGTAL